MIDYSNINDDVSSDAETISTDNEIILEQSFECYLENGIVTVRTYIDHCNT